VNVAIVHDYLNQSGGAERVVGELHRMFPSAPIYTTIVDRASLWPSLRGADIRTSWMQQLPGVQRHFKMYLPLFARAIEGFELQDYDLVISSSSAFAKGAITRPDATHICYCHTPMRFGWDYARYMDRAGYSTPVRAVLPPLIRRLREWDRRTAGRPTQYVANSSITADRIRQFYGRPSTIVPPPVDVDRFAPDAVDEGYYLVVSRLNGYKRVDLAVQAFSGFDRTLFVVGDGPVRSALERQAGRNVHFVGRLPDEEVARLYARCRALILPGEEDFGITPLEANASGRPVIAFRSGGALDTVVEGETGMLFTEQSVTALRGAVLECERVPWQKEKLRAHAEGYAPDIFARRLRKIIHQAMAANRGLPVDPSRRDGERVEWSVPGH
jgi:glycosyltransferase involved in cell wall biosynthesis